MSLQWIRFSLHPKHFGELECDHPLGLYFVENESISFAIRMVNSQSVSAHTAFNCMDHNKLWKILEEMGIPEHMTCLLRSLYAGQEATVRTGHGTTNWFQIGEGVHQGCILSSCFFNLYAEYIM